MKINKHNHLFRALPVFILCFLTLFIANDYLPLASSLEIMKKVFSAIIAVTLGTLLDWWFHIGKDRIHQLEGTARHIAWFRRLGYVLAVALVFSAAF